VENRGLVMNGKLKFFFEKMPLANFYGVFLFLASFLFLVEFLNVPLIGDDYARVIGSLNIFGSDYSSFMQGQMPDRPILMAYIWFAAGVLGKNVVLLKLASIFLHLLNVIVGFAVSLRLSRLLGYQFEKFPLLIVTLAFLAWGIHPIHWTAIVSVIQAGVLLSTLMATVAFYYGVLYLTTAGKRIYLILFSLFFTLGLLAKGTIAVLPLFFLFFYRVTPQSRKAVIQLIALSVFVLGLYGLWISNLNAHPLANDVKYSNYLIAQMKVFLWNIERLFFVKPNYRFMVDSLMFLRPGLSREMFLGGGLVLLGALASWGLGFRRSAFIGFCAYIGLLLPESMIRLPHLSFDHRLYAPTFFFLVFFLISFKPSQIKVRVLGFVVLLMVVQNAVAFVTFSKQISSVEKYLFWEINGPPTPHENGLFSLIQNLDIQPETYYYRELSKKAANQFLLNYPESATANITKHFHNMVSIKVGRQNGNVDFSASSEDFKGVIRLLTNHSASMQWEVPLVVYQKLVRSPLIYENRLRRFILLISVGSILKSHQSIVASPAALELSTLRNLIPALAREMSYFSGNPMTIEEAIFLRFPSNAVDEFQKEVSRLFPEIPYLDQFYLKNRFTQARD
jgi:hypothetical protein